MLRHRHRKNTATLAHLGIGMADMAFALLVLFVLTLVPVEEQGLKMRLETYSDEAPPCCAKVNRHNFFIIGLYPDKLLIRGEEAPWDSLRPMLKAFITNPNKSPELADNPWQATLSIGFTCETTYKNYFALIATIKSVYWELWENEAQARLNQSYGQLTGAQKRYIRTLIPYNLLEHYLFYCGDGEYY